MCVYDLGRALTKLGHRDNFVTQRGHPLTTNDSGRLAFLQGGETSRELRGPCNPRKQFYIGRNRQTV